MLTISPKRDPFGISDRRFFDYRTFYGHYLRPFPMFYSFLSTTRDSIVSHVYSRITNPPLYKDDSKSWNLTSNKMFSVKSFHCFITDDELCCRMWNFYNLRRSLPLEYYPIQLANLGQQEFYSWKSCYKGWNRLPTATCMLCRSGIKTVKLFFLYCPFTTRISNYFGYKFGLY